MQSSGPSSILRIGSRGSALALAQAELLRHALSAAHGIARERIALQIIRTTGDTVSDRPLIELGGKGLFTKEIEQVLLAGTIDIAVHSAKDMPSVLPDGLMIAATLPREDPRDVFIGHRHCTLSGLPGGATVGTASPRRQALLKRLRPDLAVVPLRGNVDTRLRKLAAGEVDGIVLALAGLKRLGRMETGVIMLDLEEFVPAVGQGIIAVETRAEDAHARALVEPISDARSGAALTCERAFLAALGGSCRTPIAGHASIEGTGLAFHGLIATTDGSAVHECTRAGAVGDAAVIGSEAGLELKARAGTDFFGAGTSLATGAD